MRKSNNSHDFDYYEFRVAVGSLTRFCKEVLAYQRDLQTFAGRPEAQTEFMRKQLAAEARETEEVLKMTKTKLESQLRDLLDFWAAHRASLRSDLRADPDNEKKLTLLHDQRCKLSELLDAESLVAAHW